MDSNMAGNTWAAILTQQRRDEECGESLAQAHTCPVNGVPILHINKKN